MINYSTYMWKSPLDETAKEQAYAKNQVTKVMSFDAVEHTHEREIHPRYTISRLREIASCIIIRFLFIKFKIGRIFIDC